MKILWIGISIGPHMLEVIKSYEGKLLSAHVSHDSILEGLRSLEIDIDSINSCQISENCCIERSRLPYIIDEKWSYNGKSKDISVSYRNVKYFNLAFRAKSLCKASKKWAKENSNEEVKVIVYSMHSPFMCAAREVKRIIPTAEVCLIVPDLPQYMDLAMSPIKKVLKKIDWCLIKQLMKKIDKYILYAEPMAEFLNLKDKQWMVMEGAYDGEIVEVKMEKNDEEKISIMYSGVLDLRYGIPELLDAMTLLGDNYELWLTGDGNAKKLIEDKVIQDKRIKYYGYLPSRKELMKKQAQATMLISPRRDNEQASRYCFPSKIFEYMVSERPVISCYLDGIPKEYYDYLICLKEVTPQCIAKTIENVARMPKKKRDKLGEDAKKFVIDNKNKYVQSKKIFDFVTNK